MGSTHIDDVTSDINNQIAQEQQAFNLVAMLKPTIKLDGDQWCVLYGDDIQSGISGFGPTPHDAILNFNKQWYTKAKPSH